MFVLDGKLCCGTFVDVIDLRGENLGIIYYKITGFDKITLVKEYTNGFKKTDLTKLIKLLKHLINARIN